LLSSSETENAVSENVQVSSAAVRWLSKMALQAGLADPHSFGNKVDKAEKGTK
jgi:hypothetical protein